MVLIYDDMSFSSVSSDIPGSYQQDTGKIYPDKKKYLQLILQSAEAGLMRSVKGFIRSFP